MIVGVSYAKVSKRVNIQRLKTDIWTDIEHTLGPAESTPAAKQSSGNTEEMSFQEMISDIAANNPRQKDVSLPFYFICLLHLANEHVRPDLFDVCSLTHSLSSHTGSEDRRPRRHE